MKLSEQTFDAKGAKALDRKAQMEILNDRKISFKASDKEDDLVKLIVESNPAPEETKEEVKEDETEEKKEPEPVVEGKGYKLKKDFTKDLREGDLVSVEKYQEMKSRGIDLSGLF